MFSVFQSFRNLIHSNQTKKLSSMGFDLDVCKQAFDAFQSDMEKTLNFMLENRNSGEAQDLKNKVEELVQSVTDRPRTSKDDFEMRQKTLDAQSLLSKLSAEMSEDDEAYLDLNTDEDAFYIDKYLSMLE